MNLSPLSKKLFTLFLSSSNQNHPKNAAQQTRERQTIKNVHEKLGACGYITQRPTRNNL